MMAIVKQKVTHTDESPLFDYYIEPIVDEDQYYVKRISKVKQPLIKHGGTPGGMFTKPEPPQVEDPNERWLSWLEWSDDGKFAQTWFTSEYAIENGWRYGTMYSMRSSIKVPLSESEAEKVIMYCIGSDIWRAKDDAKRKKLKEIYEQRKERLTRKVPPYKKLK